MDNLNDIINNLSADDINMLKGVASSILGENAAAEGNGQKAQESQPAGGGSLSPAGLDGIDFEMIMKAKTIFEKMNGAHNKNLDLIMALKPHLSPDKQDRADQAVRILKLFEVLPMLKELF